MIMRSIAVSGEAILIIGTLCIVGVGFALLYLADLADRERYK